MCVRQAEILQKAQHGPIVLVERGSKPALVVLSPALWNALAERIEFLEDAVAVYKKQWELATSQDEMTELSPADIEEWLGDTEIVRVGKRTPKT